MMYLVVTIAGLFFIVERLWPSAELPKVRAWWPRVVLLNGLHLSLTLLAGLAWAAWGPSFSLLQLSERLGPVGSGTFTYLVSAFVFYWWHRLRHESALFWRLCHQLHHSPARLEIFTSFYKHPVEALCNALLCSLLAYPLMGCDVKGAAVYTLLAASAEFFYHWNISTPHWLGYLIQRPESHRVHHQRARHTRNYGDLPILDIAFGTFQNPRRFQELCGFEPHLEDRLEDMLAFRDVHAAAKDGLPAWHWLPTCIGCSRRWACAETHERLSGAEVDVTG